MPSSACKTCARSEEHTSELQSHSHLVCRLLLENKYYKNSQDDTRRSAKSLFQGRTRVSAALSPASPPVPLPSAPPRRPGPSSLFFLNQAPPPECPPLPRRPPFRV